MFGRRKNPIVISAPTAGRLVDLADVPDPVFARRSVGDGFALQPDDGLFRSPADGELLLVAPTGHAFALRTDDGVEVLVHIGIDTVKCRGEGFEVHRRAGERVRRGDLVVSADLARLAECAPSLVTPVLVTNVKDFEVTQVSPGDGGGDPAMTVRRR